MELQDKIALITGAAKRIGRAIALAMARAGADVAVHYNHSSEGAKGVSEEIRRMGRQAELFQADLAKPDEIAGMFDAIRHTFGRLDVLVNNAAVYDRTPIETLSPEQWDAEFAVNARAPALCIHHAVPLMRERGGAIINITDIAAEKARPGLPAYCASKAALLGLTQSAAKALARYNIRVNAVAPGVVIWQHGTTEEDKQAALAQVPMKRPGAAEDIAAAVVFLACADYITGQNLRVDGGWCM